MISCPKCGTENADSQETCVSCGQDFTLDSPTLVQHDTPTVKGGMSDLGSWRKRSQAATILPAGFQIGERYRVIGLLGRGGMGMVYRAYDNELEREVALKFINAEVEEQPDAIERFKREIQLSSTVTHRNVLRVYDLGESGGVKFLTMQLVEGEDLLRVLMREGAIEPERAESLFRQICEGLAAAHEQGVIHRDLKPANIMVDKEDHAYVTDFGLARTADQLTLTMDGAVVGTPHYMSPEQVRGEPLDARSDIYSLGVLFFQMLSGTVPYSGASMYQIMMERVQRPAPSVRALKPEVPERLSRVVQRCLAIEKEKRYQSVAEILADLDGEAAAAARVSGRMFWAVAAVALVAIVAVAGLMWMRHQAQVAAAQAVTRKPVSVLIADIANKTGDPIFERTLEPMLSIAMEGARFVTAYDRGSARKAAEQLKPGSTSLDEPLARLVGIREGIDVVVSGVLTKAGDGYKLTARAIEPSTGRVIGDAEADASTRENVLTAATDLAVQLRKRLGDAPTSAQLANETFTAASLAAAQKYAAGQDLQWSGKYQEAIAAYSAAVAIDPTMGRAYSGIAAMYANLDDSEQAEKYYKLAMRNIDRMTDREKYRTRSGYYLLVRNSDKAVEELTTLVNQFPADTAALNNLALAHFYRRDMKRAVAEGKRIVAIYPKNVLYRNNLALYALYASDFGLATTHAQEVLRLNPSFAKAHVVIALAQIAKGEADAARATYEKLAPVSARGASFAAAGLADLALYRGDAAAAVDILRKGIAADTQAKNKNAAARKEAMLAEALLLAGKKDEAMAAAGRAAASSSSETVLYPAATQQISARDFADAEKVVASLKQKLESEPQIAATLLEGQRHLEEGRARDALTSFRAAQRTADSWLGRFFGGRAYRELGAFTEAYSELDAAQRRRGEALCVMLDDVPTARYLPLLDYELARAQEGLGSPAARESYERVLKARTLASDRIAADAKKRLGR